MELDGDIAVMANGAGITMATLDTLQAYGATENFLDCGGHRREATAKALEILLSLIQAVFINIFGELPVVMMLLTLSGRV